MKSLFLAWQSPADSKQARAWFPIGRLDADVERPRYWFCYTQGALKAKAEAGFGPRFAFPELNAVYESKDLFPLFQNRVLSPKRSDFNEYIRWAGSGSRTGGSNFHSFCVWFRLSDDAIEDHIASYQSMVAARHQHPEELATLYRDTKKIVLTIDGLGLGNHFFRDLAKPVLALDSTAKKKTRAKIRGLRACRHPHFLVENRRFLQGTMLPPG